MKAISRFFVIYLIKLIQFFFANLFRCYAQGDLFPINDYNFLYLYYSFMTFFSIYVAFICPLLIVLLNIMIMKFDKDKYFEKKKIIFASLSIVIIEAAIIGHYSFDLNYSSIYQAKEGFYEFNNYILILMSIGIDSLTGILFGFAVYKVNKLFKTNTSHSKLTKP
jgi:hypothetical protein